MGLFSKENLDKVTPETVSKAQEIMSSLPPPYARTVTPKTEEQKRTDDANFTARYVAVFKELVEGGVNQHDAVAVARRIVFGRE